MKARLIPTLVFLVFALAADLFAAGAVKDEWLHVRSRNFNLIGNASEKEIVRVATKLEQFREAFRVMFTGSNLSSPIPTNVVVFKSDGAYRPFKPKRGDGKTDNFIAGYFQPGDDVNYITLSTGGNDADTFGTIFHEYVHFIVNTNIGKSGVPAWFNEGLAEYYQTFVMEDDIKAKLGIPQNGHLALLQQNKLLPFDSFFNTSNASLLGHGSGARSVFYAQAWAVVHYLIANKKTAGLDKYLSRSMKGNVDEAAFSDAFQMSYAQMEKELRQYVGKGSYIGTVVTFKQKLTFDGEMRITPLSEAESNAYLGDLLYHTHRYDDAEPLLASALSLDPNLSMANTTMGMVKVRQRKYPEAKVFLEKAIAKDPKNHLAYYQMAYLISREARDEFGFVSEIPAANATKMRELLKRAMELHPSFTESYELLAFLNIVRNERIDEGISAMAKALQYQPGNQRYALRIAELYIRQDKFSEASDLASRIAKTTDEPEVKKQAENLLEQIRVRNEIMAQNAESRKRYEAAIAAGAKDGGMQPYLIKRGADGKEPTPEEIKRQSQEFEVRSINRELRKPESAETRLLGKLSKIECKAGQVMYTVTTEKETFALASKDFEGLNFAAYVMAAANLEIGCDAKLAEINAVLTYRPRAAHAKVGVRGELVSVEFVPPHFRFVDPASEPVSPPDAAAGAAPAPAETIEAVGTAPAPAPAGDLEADRKRSFFEHIRNALRKPAEGEKRVLGFIEKSECTQKGTFFYLRTGTLVLKLNGGGDSRPELKGYTPDIENVQFGCGMKALDVPAVITYREALDKKSKHNGDLVALEFVPKDFVL